MTYTPSAYASIHVHDASAAQNVATGATYTKMTCFTDDGDDLNATSDAANDKIIITEPGVYRAVCSISWTSGTNSVTFFGSLFVDGTENDALHVTRKIGTAGDVGSATISGLLTVATVPVDIDLRMRHDNGGTVAATISYSNLSINKIG